MATDDERLSVGARVTVGGSVPNAHDGKTGTIVRRRGVLGVPLYIVRLDGTTRKGDAHVELFATELQAAQAAIAAITDAPVAVIEATPAEASAGAVALSRFDPFFDKAYAGKELAELAAAPVDALRGVSAGDAELLAAAFGIRTVGDLALHPFIRVAQAITKFADAG